MRTYSILKWCGMPYELNPRKCAKMGYVCTAERQLTCSDLENCGSVVCLPSELMFNANPVEVERALM